MIEFLRFINLLLDLYSYVLIATIILSWLIAFNIVNARSQIVSTIGDFLYRATEPVLAPIRRALPNMGPVDLSPLVVFLGIIFIQMVILPNIARALH